jgi:hypothetical protein
MFSPAGITAEGTLAPDKLHAGDHPIEQKGVTLKTTLKLARGTLVYLKSGETQYEAYDGGTITSGSLLGLLVDDVDTTGGAASVAVYISGDFNTNGITVAAGGSLATVRERLALQSLYLRDGIAA